MRPPVCFIVLLCGLICGAAGAGPVISMQFDHDEKLPGLTGLIGDSRIEEGLLKTRPRADWRRSGLDVGPLPVGGGVWTIEYDFRPGGFGNQCQSFVSQSPSTHWYMMYVRPDGRINLHTRVDGEWKARASSDTALQVGQWYHATVSLAAEQIRIKIRPKDGPEALWDTGDVAVDSIAPTTVFALVDEAPDTVGATEWDNLQVSTDDPDAEARMVELARELQQQREAQRRQELAAENLQEAGVALIPFPQVVELTPDRGNCALTGDLTIGGWDEALRAMVAEVLQERLGLTASGLETGGTIRIRRMAQDDPLADRGPQAYRLAAGSDGVLMEALTPQGVYYGAQTLCQLVGETRECPGIAIHDWPAIDSRLVMIAVSQGAFQVIDVDYWKRIIRELAAVKITHIMPYLEGGTFYYEKYPFLGVKGRDGFTVEKGKALSEYAKEHFIRIVPQQQSLGHSGSMLTHEELKDLRETGGVFCSSEPKTFEFLGDLYDELAGAFPHSDYIHVGGDEFAHGFAKCPRCKARAEEIGPEGLYAEHMVKLHGMLAQRGRKMMIWWHEQGFTDKAADKMPKDIGIFDWHYGNQHSYPSIARLQEEGFSQVWATPAVTRYYGGANDWDNTFGNISGFLRAGAQRGVPGECTCTWVHGIWGGRNMFELNLYGLVFSGNCAWNPLASDYAQFRWRFGRHWFGLQADQAEEQVMQALHAPYGESAAQGFWVDNRMMEPMLAEPLSKTAQAIAERPELVEQAKDLAKLCRGAQAILRRWEASAKRNKVTATYLAHDVHIHATVARRILAVKALMDSHEQAQNLGPPEIPDQYSPDIANLRRLVKDYQQIEETFDRSVLEAGGGKCGWGGWYPFVTQGGVQFRAVEGRQHIEEQIKHLTKAINSASRPEPLFVE